MLRQVPHERIEGLLNSQQSLDETTVEICRNRFGANNILDTPAGGSVNLNSQAPENKLIV